MGEPLPHLTCARLTPHLPGPERFFQPWLDVFVSYSGIWVWGPWVAQWLSICLWLRS